MLFRSHTRQRLSTAGFEAYEVSNFAGAGGPSRHNDHYWLQGDYVGIGPGAASHRDGVRSTNAKTVEAWAKAVLAGHPAAATAETLRPRQRLAEALWLGIRRREGVDVDAIAARLRVPPEQAWRVIETQTRNGLVEVRQSRICLTPAGLLLADRVGAELLGIGADR